MNKLMHSFVAYLLKYSFVQILLFYLVLLVNYVIRLFARLFAYSLSYHLCAEVHCSFAPPHSLPRDTFQANSHVQRLEPPLQIPEVPVSNMDPYTRYLA